MDRNTRRFRLFVSISSLIHFICCISLVSGIIRAEPRCIESERRALLRLKEGFVDDYGLLSSWSSHRSSHDCCLWRGVGCSNTTGHVIVLDLHGNWPEGSNSAVALSGDISSSLLDLNHLNHLDLSFSSFTRIPSLIGSFEKLHYLNLSFVTLEVSKVPPQLGNLSSLQVLDLSASSVVLKNMEWFSKLSSLEYLSLNYVDLTESSNLLKNVLALPSLFELHLAGCMFPSLSTNMLLPLTNFSRVLSILDVSSNLDSPLLLYPWLFNFSGSLTSIDLSYNVFNGTIPEAFGTFTSLLKLDLTMTYLKQDLPSFFRLLQPLEKSLQVLKLDENEFFGSLPDFTKFTALKELHLYYNKMNGSFPERFEKVSNLVILDVSDNQITGLLPDLSVLPSLQELYVERNRLEGTLAEKIMSLFELQMLWASGNMLNGTITETHLSNLSHLAYLDLSYNSLVLEIDPAWIPTFSLNVLTLASCKLGPSFPPWLQNQKNFTILDISDAQINDSVPYWLWNQLTPNLKYLNLSFNYIHGIVPDLMYGNEPYIDLSSNNFFGHVPLFPPNSVKIFLRHNMFSGPISSLCNLTNIMGLELSNNQLSGKVPDCWMNFTKVFYLNLENNKFSGTIPTSMGNLSDLQMLSMRNNNLTGELPSSLKHCTKLVLLDVGENGFWGHIPTWIGKSLSGLRVLSLTSNRFHGTIPTSLFRLSNMQILDLSLNNISGTIPSCLGSFKGMVGIKNVSFIGLLAGAQHSWFPFVDRSDYMFEALLQWKGRKYQYSNTLGLVTSLDLSSNNLNGKIPLEIINLLGLVALNLSRNNLSWNIPQDIGKLRRLDFLDLSRNHLSGGIPTSLSQLASLGMLDLSHNNLSGRIPTSTQLQSFGASSYTGNTGLCGLPLPNRCPGDLVPQNPRTKVETEDKGDEEDKFITRGFFICLWTGLACGFWGFCGSLVFRDAWRDSYFKFWDHCINWIYVVIVVNYNKLRRRS